MEKERMEEERETHFRLCEALFDGSRRLEVRREDIPFQGWSSAEIVSLLLQNVRHQVGGYFTKCRLHYHLSMLVGTVFSEEDNKGSWNSTYPISFLIENNIFKYFYKE